MLSESTAKAQAVRALKVPSCLVPRLGLGYLAGSAYLLPVEVTSSEFVLLKAHAPKLWKPQERNTFLPVVSHLRPAFPTLISYPLPLGKHQWGQVCSCGLCEIIP